MDPECPAGTQQAGILRYGVVPQMEDVKCAKTAAATLFVLPIAGFSQSLEIGPGGVRVDDGRTRRGGGQCEQLRQACENKDRLGERGEGNCRTYRETCQKTRRPERVRRIKGGLSQ